MLANPPKTLDCYHCGQSVPSNINIVVNIAGRGEPMCCIGCQAVAMAIVDGGLENFYSYRTALNSSISPDSFTSSDSNLRDWSIYDLPDIQTEFVSAYDQHNQQATLLIEGISCAACSWLIETHLKKNPAISIVTVNASTHRCTIVWQANKLALSEIFASLYHIGYIPRPATDEQQEHFFKSENRIALFRLGIAGFGMMQSMMVAVGIYFGATDSWLDFLRWLSMLVATPVVFFSASPFFKSAARSLRSKHLTMDVPVSLAIILSYAASAWATVFGGGEVYFESVSMFVFFLLMGRHLEQRARHRNKQAFSSLAQLMPLSACCISSTAGVESFTQVPVKTLALNNIVLVRPGETFPCDGVVISGESEVVEALMTGESIPVAKKISDKVIAGTLNVHSPLRVRVSAIGVGTQLSNVERLAIQAADEKPKQVLMADQMARFFIARLLIVCLAVFVFWWFKDASRALWITLSVLVVTCPCALALAMPAALSAATANLRKGGFLVARGHVIETLTSVTRVIFDKTGTLTLGKFRVVDVLPLQDISRESALAIAAALEQDSNHPIAQAFTPYAQALRAGDVKQITASGVEGIVSGEIYRLGTAVFSQEIQAVTTKKISPPTNAKLWVLLSNPQGAVAWISLEDELRPSAQAAISELQTMGIEVELLSGDPSNVVAQMAAQLGISQYQQGATPADKLARVTQLQAQGESVLMVGDGINDIPVLAGANVSVAMACASDLAQARADSVLLSNQLTQLPQAIRLANLTRQIIRQNLYFSLSYNLLALPLAASGHVAPWAAAIGMTMSSLFVVMNALRLSK